MLDTVFQDLRYAGRLLVRNPGFTVVAVVTLALGIGANVAIYSVVDAVLIAPLPYEDSGDLVFVWGVEGGLKSGSSWNSFPDIVDFEARNDSFSGMASFTGTRITLTGPDLEPKRVDVARATHDLFDVLGAKPAEGRGFLPEEDVPGGDPVVVLSHGLRHELFGDAPDVLGRVLTLDGQAHAIVGVMPEGFDLNQVRMWIPAGPVHGTDHRSMHRLMTVARLKPGVSIEQAEANMVAVAAALEEEYPTSNHQRSARVEPLHESFLGNIRSRLLLLSGAVGLVLLIACANVASLLLTRSAMRKRELAVRAAVGAGPVRIVRQMLTESVLLSFLGGIAGLVVAQWGLDLLVSLAPGGILRLEQTGLNARVLGFSLVLTVGTGLLFGLLPALQVRKRDLQGALSEGAGGWLGGGRRNGLRQVLVVGEVALAVIVVMIAALLTNSLLHLQRVDPGFRGDSVLAASLSLPKGSYPEWRQATQFYAELLEQLEQLPGVESAAAGYQHPLAGGWETSFLLPGVFEAPPGQRPEARILPVTPGYFRTVGMQQLRGRDFTHHDDETAPGVVIINESFAKSFFGDDDPLGHQIVRHQWWDELPFEYEIVGVVSDVKMDGLDASTPWAMYYPQKQVPFQDLHLLLRTSIEPTIVADSVRKTVWKMDRNLPVEEFATLAQLQSRSVGQERFQVVLLGLFATVAMVLAAIGIYGVLSSGVVQRRREIGVRMALGASTRDVLRGIVRQGMRLTLIGLVLGLGGALAAMRVLRGFLFQVTATDPLTVGTTCLLFGVVALVACLVPAGRATRVDPIEVLRTE